MDNNTNVTPGNDSETISDNKTNMISDISGNNNM